MKPGPLPRKLSWIVVADASRARLLAHRGGKELEPALESDLLSSARVAGRYITADRPGRVHERHGPVRHGVAPKTDVDRVEQEKLARRIAESLRSGAQRTGFEQLVIVAPPSMLGAIREALDEPIRKKVVAELPREIVGKSEAELANYLDEELSLGALASGALARRKEA